MQNLIIVVGKTVLEVKLFIAKTQNSCLKTPVSYFNPSRSDVLDDILK